MAHNSVQLNTIQDKNVVRFEVTVLPNVYDDFVYDLLSDLEDYLDRGCKSELQYEVVRVITMGFHSEHVLQIHYRRLPKVTIMYDHEQTLFDVCYPTQDIPNEYYSLSDPSYREAIRDSMLYNIGTVYRWL